MDHTHRTACGIGRFAHPLRAIAVGRGGVVSHATSQTRRRLYSAAFRRGDSAAQNSRVDGWKTLAEGHCTATGKGISAAVFRLAASFDLCGDNLARI